MLLLPYTDTRPTIIPFLPISHLRPSLQLRNLLLPINLVSHLIHLNDYSIITFLMIQQALLHSRR